MTARFCVKPARPGAFPRARPSRLGDRRLRALFAGVSAAFFALGVSPGVSRADDLQELEHGKSRFDAGKYEEARGRFAAMLDPKSTPCGSGATNPAEICRLTDPDIIERARTLLAATLVALKKDEEAEEQIATILRTNPSFSPDPAVLPQEVVDRFTLVRARLRAELAAEEERRAEEDRKHKEAMEKARQDERRWLESLKKAASEQPVVVRHSRLVAAVPFGVGQFQNGSTKLGYLFAISQGTAALTAIVSAQFFTYYASYDPTIAIARDRQLLLDRQHISLMINKIAFSTWAALAIGGIVQAQVGFVPQTVEIHKRPLPPPPKTPSVAVLPMVNVGPKDVTVGLIGTF